VNYDAGLSSEESGYVYNNEEVIVHQVGEEAGEIVYYDYEVFEETYEETIKVAAEAEAMHMV